MHITIQLSNLMEEIKDAKKGKLEINGTNGTKGDGTAYLYGNEAQAMKGRS
ncbi:MAG: hypothetical protein U5K55_15635 [Aliarcobacter sp.]|nr:hypothetical protein [Aliarcobacter sp.]